MKPQVKPRHLSVKQERRDKRASASGVGGLGVAPTMTSS